MLKPPFKIFFALLGAMSTNACAGSQAEIAALEKSFRALEARLVRAESANQTLNDKVFVVSAQVDECRAAIESRSSTGSADAPRVIEPLRRDEALERLDPTVPDHLRLVSSQEPEPDPIQLRLHGDPAVLDVTDVPPPPTPKDPEIARVDFERGLDAFRRGDFRAARAAFEAFVDENPAHARADNAMYWVGECSYELGDYADALTAFRRIVNEYPESRKVPDAMFKVGTAYEQLQDGRNARRAFERLVKRFPRSAYAELARARL